MPTTETPRHIESGKGYGLPTVLCPRCNRAMSVKRSKEEVKGWLGTGTKFHLKYNCKDCETEWEEDEKPKNIAWSTILLIVMLVIIFLIVIRVLISGKFSGWLP